VRVVLTDAAEADLAELYAYYGERSGPAADQVLEAVLRAMASLVAFPLLGRPGSVPHTRERILTRYPYRFVYHLDEATQVIEVWRVIHDARQWPPAE